MLDKTIIQTENAPLPIGPYSQGVSIHGMLFISGQIPIDPETGEVVEGDIKKETQQVMDNLKAILDKAGLDFQNVVKCSIFLTDMNDFPVVNEVYGEYFDEEEAPARETVQVAALPKNVRVEISLMAVE